MSEQHNNHPPEMTDDPNHTEVMTAAPEPDDAQDGYDGYGDDEFGGQDEAGFQPPRPRRVLVNRWSALLLAVLIGGACFYLGVRVEKSRFGTSSTAAASGRAGLAARFGSAGGGGTAAGGRSGAAGFGAAGFGGAAPGGGTTGGGTTGTITTIDGNTLYLAETGGNTVKVNLSDATTLKKTSTVSKAKLYPGDTLAVTGTTGSSGAIKATAITDSGSSGSAASSASSSTGSSSSSTSGSSGLSSLFSG